MVRYGIIFKKKGAKVWQGSQLARKGISAAKLQSFIKKNKKPGYEIKVVTDAQIRALKTLYKKIVSSAKRKVARRGRKRVVRRRKVARKTKK